MKGVAGVALWLGAPTKQSHRQRHHKQQQQPMSDPEYVHESMTSKEVCRSHLAGSDVLWSSCSMSGLMGEGQEGVQAKKPMQKVEALTVHAERSQIVTCKTS